MFCFNFSYSFFICEVDIRHLEPSVKTVADSLVLKGQVRVQFQMTWVWKVGTIPLLPQVTQRNSRSAARFNWASRDEVKNRRNSTDTYARTHGQLMSWMQARYKRLNKFRVDGCRICNACQAPPLLLQPLHGLLATPNCYVASEHRMTWKASFWDYIKSVPGTITPVNEIHKLFMSPDPSIFLQYRFSLSLHDARIYN